MDQVVSPIPSSASNSSEFKIGVLLIKSGKITSSDVRQVVELSNAKSIRFGDAAIELGFVTQADINEVLAKQFDYTHLTYSDNFSPHLITAFYPNSAEAEFIRSLRTQLSLKWLKDDRKAISVSSIDSGSGNSRFVANLAIAFSQSGKKTVLIDANLRSPTQQSFFNYSPQQRGLSDILIGRAGLDVVKDINAISKLSVLPSGTIPPNPQELVSGSVFKELVDFLHEIFDVILIDTPAFSVGADAEAIAVAAGRVLLVARKDVTRASKMKDTANVLASYGSQVVGTVLTDF